MAVRLNQKWLTDLTYELTKYSYDKEYQMQTIFGLHILIGENKEPIFYELVECYDL